MRSSRLASLSMVIVLAAVSLSGCKLAVVKPLGEDGKPILDGGHKTFSAAEYVDTVWESQILPAVENGAADLAQVLAALEADPEAAKAEYGHREGTGPYTFLIKAQGQVTQVDTSSRVGKFYLDVDPADGQADVTVQIGPVIQGSAIRDGVGFITFDLFINQIEYASVSNELNERVLATTLSGLDASQLQGKNVTLYGVMTLQGDARVVTPVKLEVGG